MGQREPCFRSGCLSPTNGRRFAGKAVETICRLRLRLRSTATPAHVGEWRHLDRQTIGGLALPLTCFTGLKMVDRARIRSVFRHPSLLGAANGQSWPGRNAKGSLTDIGGSQSKAQL